MCRNHRNVDDFRTGPDLVMGERVVEHGPYTYAERATRDVVLIADEPNDSLHVVFGWDREAVKIGAQVCSGVGNGWDHLVDIRSS